ncbi:MAG: DUF4199 domain-containing protein [Bacteroidetes bacterium]|nr:DUF4199 domain-containing protein [Bacteroidota bacterium]
MRKNVLVFGSIAGIIVSTFMFVSMLLFSKDVSGAGSMLVGYAAMLVAFSFVFVGIKNFRDKYNDGLITFGKGFKIGILISLIASTFYVITWIFELKFVLSDFMENYSSNMLKQVQVSGLSQIEIDKQIAEIERNKEMYKNPLFLILITYMEIFPVGLLVTLVSALILKKKVKQQTQTI